MGAAEELKRLERELEQRLDGTDRPPTPPPEPAELAKPGDGGKLRHRGFDLVLIVCALLITGSVGILWVQRMHSEQARALQHALAGAAAGVLAGYAVGRWRD